MVCVIAAFARAINMISSFTPQVYRHPDNVMSLCWKDKRPIYMLSTWHNGESETTSQIVGGGRREEIEKPLVISDYTENMGAVDKADHTAPPTRF